MNEFKYRFLLTVIFTIGACVLIYNKFNVKTETITPSLTQETQIKTIEPTSSVKRQADSEPTSDKTAPSLQPTQNNLDFLNVVQDCLNVEANQIANFNDLKVLFDLETTDPQRVRQKNFIYMIDGQEKRVSLLRSENAQTWKIDEYDVDEEGLPIPGPKNAVTEYQEALKFIKNKYPKPPNLTESEITINDGDHKGKALLVNNNLANLSVYSVNQKRQLECENSRCLCN